MHGNRAEPPPNSPSFGTVSFKMEPPNPPGHQPHLDPTTTTPTLQPHSTSSLQGPELSLMKQEAEGHDGTEDDARRDENASEWEKERPIRRKRRVKGQKVCGVCGDLAQSHNFGALTCETCKAFFRRNAFKQKELQTCVFNSSCTITKATRRFCAPCRLKKCFAIEMDPELILDDDEKKARQSRRKREACLTEEACSRGGVSSSREPHSATSPSASASSSTSFPSSSSFSSSSSASPSSFSQRVSPSTSLGSLSETGAESEGSSQAHSEYPDKGKWRRPTNALGCRFKHVTPEDMPCDMQLYWPLTAEERTALASIATSYQVVISIMKDEDKEQLKQWDSVCMEKVFFALEHSMRQFVQFARTIPEFQELKQRDQIALLKATSLHWYHIRLASEFIPERHAWNNVFGCCTVTELGSFFGDQHGLHEYAEFSEGLKFVLKNDLTSYALLSILVFFDSRDPNVEERVKVNRFKDRYLVLFKHYLESQFSYLHADRYMAEIFQQVMDLLQLSQTSHTWYKHFSAHFRPLVAEVLAD